MFQNSPTPLAWGKTFSRLGEKSSPAKLGDLKRCHFEFLESLSGKAGTSYVPGSKLLVLGMVIQPFNRESL